MDTSFIVVPMVATLGFVLLSFVVARRLSTRILGGSPAKQAQAQQLRETGQRARATILSIQPTGTIVNHINIECAVRFRLDPLDGAASFEGDKTFYINQTRMPRVGDVWPCWYESADLSTFAVGQPDLSNAETQRTLAEFGIDNPLSQTGGASPPPPAAGSDPEDERLDALERLGDLRARGLLSNVEFEAEKRRLLDS